jgi:hypothetical protein
MSTIGEIEIQLNGKTETLRPSLEAAKKVNTGGGGFMNVLQKLAVMDQDYYSLVVAAGLGKRPAEVDAVWRTGLPNLTESLALFVQSLANGGRPIAGEEGV